MKRIAFLLFLLPVIAIAKDYKPKLGPYCPTNRFVNDKVFEREHLLFRYSPVNNKTIAYDYMGNVVTLSLKDTICSTGIYTGAYKAQKGRWIQFYKPELGSDCYVFLEKMKIVEAQAKLSDKMKYAKARETQKKAAFDEFWDKVSGFLIAFIVIVLISVIMYYGGNSSGSAGTTGSITATGDKPFNSGNWYNNGGSYSDTYGGPTTYGFGLPNSIGKPKKNIDGNYYQNGKRINK